jgi:CDP-diacylglycerol pyrophosphatase
MSPPAQAPSRFGRLRLSDYSRGRQAALIAAALLGALAFAYLADLASRKALLEVVRACVLDKTMTGSPAPCLKVDAAADYIVLRPPIGRPDTILAPTRAIVGVEDKRLQAPDAPNYFALAWDERRWAVPAADDDRAALAVNSILARTQDQLHVHIGCLGADFAARLRSGALGPTTGTWFRSADIGPGLEFWTYRTGAKDWRGLAPFRLLKVLVGDSKVMRRTTLAVTATPDEFVVAAMVSRPGGWYAAVEDLLAPRC